MRVVRHGFKTLVLLPKLDRVGLNPRVRPLRQNGNDARIQPTTQEAGYRDVGNEMGRHGVLDNRAERDRGPHRGALGFLFDLPVSGHCARPVGPELSPGPGFELLNPPDCAALRRYPVVQDRGHQGAHIGLEGVAKRTDDALQLRAKDHAVLANEIVEGLYPEWITRQEELSATFLEDREREHSTEPRERLWTPSPPSLQHDFGVGVRREARPAGG